MLGGLILSVGDWARVGQDRIRLLALCPLIEFAPVAGQVCITPSEPFGVPLVFYGLKPEFESLSICVGGVAALVHDPLEVVDFSTCGSLLLQELRTIELWVLAPTAISPTWGCVSA